MTKPSLGMCAGACLLVSAMLACSLESITAPNSPGQGGPATATAGIDRQASIPTGMIKMSPATDLNPPQVYATDYAQPQPVPGDVNTAGAEDSPFVTWDGNTLYFFFTPDVRVPVEKQVLDGVTGIYVSQKANGEWGKAERLILQEPGKLAMDGCEFVRGELMWFCSAREGWTGVHWFTAKYLDGRWQDWKLSDFPAGLKVGELYFSKDGSELYFGSDRPGGKGGLDIWVSKNIDGTWQEPENIQTVNTADSEGWPALNFAEDELWFSRNYGIWRSKKAAGIWQAAELVASPLAGEPSLDADGNLYFVHHFYQGDVMLEADIYVAMKK